MHILNQVIHHVKIRRRILFSASVLCVVCAIAKAAIDDSVGNSSASSMQQTIDAVVHLAADHGAEPVRSDTQPLNSDLSNVAQSESQANVVQPDLAKKGLSLTAVGDVMLGSAYPNESELPPKDATRVLEQVTPFLGQTDVTFANLEGVVTDQTSLVRDCGNSTACFRFAMPSRYITHLKQAGINAVSIANNHMFDAGEAGVASSQQHLNQQLVYFGSEQQPTAVQVLPDGRTVGWVGFAPHSGTNRPSVERITQQVRELKQRNQFVVVSFHVGAEGASAQHVTRQDELFMGNNRGNIYQFAHAAIDAGADIVLGHGPHVLRGMELYQGHLIAYSLGNFATYGRFNLKDVNGLAGILQVQLNSEGQFVSGRFLSTIQSKNSPTWLQGIGPVIDAQQMATTRLSALSQDDFPNSPLRISPDGTLSIKDNK